MKTKRLRKSAAFFFFSPISSQSFAGHTGRQTAVAAGFRANQAVVRRIYLEIEVGVVRHSPHLLQLARHDLQLTLVDGIGGVDARCNVGYPLWRIVRRVRRVLRESR